MKHLINIIAVVLLFAGCELSDRDLLAPDTENERPLNAEITKWYNGYAAAVALNYDHGYPVTTKYSYDAIRLTQKHNVIMDYDIGSYEVSVLDSMRSFIFNTLIPKGYGFFGHGHKHDNHDAKSYDGAYKSFKTNYDFMLELGIKPVSYAYPGGWGYHLKTRRALKDAGFLNGRKFEQLDIVDPFIMPGNEMEPKDWYALPTLIMQSEDYDGCIVCINNADELGQYLDKAIEKTAWLILTYHFIGDLDNYGFYYLPEFEKDLLAVKSRNIWNDKMDNITLYAYERKDAELTCLEVRNEDNVLTKIKLKIDDKLPDDYFDQPLTIKFNLPEECINKELVLVKHNEEISNHQFNSGTAMISILPDNIFYELKIK